jgi:hypothetical protein
MILNEYIRKNVTREWKDVSGRQPEKLITLNFVNRDVKDNINDTSTRRIKCLQSTPRQVNEESNCSSPFMDNHFVRGIRALWCPMLSKIYNNKDNTHENAVSFI